MFYILSSAIFVSCKWTLYNALLIIKLFKRIKISVQPVHDHCAVYNEACEKQYHMSFGTRFAFRYDMSL
jgi:hypothetical protein